MALERFKRDSSGEREKKIAEEVLRTVNHEEWAQGERDRLAVEEGVVPGVSDYMLEHTFPDTTSLAKEPMLDMVEEGEPEMPIEQVMQQVEAAVTENPHDSNPARIATNVINFRQR